jgi:broad specificity phosphatase PhoE
MEQVRERVGPWIDGRTDSAVTLLVVTHAAVMRAAIAHVLSLPLRATLQIDIAPLATMTLSHHRQWRLQELRRA